MEKLHDLSFSSRMEWSTVSKALDRSRKTAPVTKPLSMLFKIVSVKCASAISVESLGLMPNCRDVRILLLLR